MKPTALETPRTSPTAFCRPCPRARRRDQREEWNESRRAWLAAEVFYRRVSPAGSSRAVRHSLRQQLRPPGFLCEACRTPPFCETSDRKSLLGESHRG